MGSLLKDFDEIDFTMDDLEDDIEELQRIKERAERMTQFGKTADILYDAYDAFIEAGFNKEQAFKILITYINK